MPTQVEKQVKDQGQEDPTELGAELIRLPKDKLSEVFNALEPEELDRVAATAKDLAEKKRRDLRKAEFESDAEAQDFRKKYRSLETKFNKSERDQKSRVNMSVPLTLMGTVRILGGSYTTLRDLLDPDKTELKTEYGNWMDFVDLYSFDVDVNKSKAIDEDVQADIQHAIEEVKNEWCPEGKIRALKFHKAFVSMLEEVHELREQYEEFKNAGYSLEELLDDGEDD